MKSNKILLTAVVIALGVLGVALIPNNTTTSNTSVVTATVPVTVQPVQNNTPITKKVSRLTIPASKVVFLLGPIYDVTNVVAELKEKARASSDIWLLIDSPGGSVLDGAKILSVMEASPARVHTVCLGLCASMAFIIHQYGYTRNMVDRSIIMAHPASGGVQGTLEQMNSRLGTITRYVYKMDAYIANRVGMKFEQFKALSLTELWLDAEDALAFKFVDNIVDVTTDAQPPEQLDLFQKWSDYKFKEKINLNW